MGYIRGWKSLKPCFPVQILEKAKTGLILTFREKKIIKEQTFFRFYRIMDKPIRVLFAYNKNITVKKNGQYLNVNLNDNIFENGQLEKKKIKALWLKLNEVFRLRDTINSVEEDLNFTDVRLLASSFESRECFFIKIV